jgi:hypothetical protein
MDKSGLRSSKDRRLPGEEVFGFGDIEKKFPSGNAAPH